jgi:hypothetical protein
MAVPLPISNVNRDEGDQPVRAKEPPSLRLEKLFGNYSSSYAGRKVAESACEPKRSQ